MKIFLDHGYGSGCGSSSVGCQPKNYFKGNFNKDLFNHEFEKYKQEQKKKMGSQMVQYQEPVERLSMKNQDLLVTLGQGTISNFSGGKSET